MSWVVQMVVVVVVKVKRSRLSRARHWSPPAEQLSALSHH